MSDTYPYAQEITSILVRKYGRPTLGNKKNPFNELLYIILSSKTPPARYQEVYRTLRSSYKQARDLAVADPERLATVLSIGGLQHRKARAIVSISRRLLHTFGRVTLSPLIRMETASAETFLTNLPEVSKKTARCVLLYSLNRDVFPVDSHCFRVTVRLGWVDGRHSLTDRMADEIQRRVPSALRRDLHVGMILLGREYCLPHNPRCRECPVVTFCRYGKSVDIAPPTCQ